MPNEDLRKNHRHFRGSRLSGWDEGLRMIGRRDVLGIEWCKWACETAEAAGHRRLHGDVSLLTPIDCIGHISSPPCTKFSSAGSGVGVLLIDMLADGIRRIFAGEDCRAGVREDAYPICLAERERANEARKPSKRWSLERVEKAARNDAFTSCLVLEPARWIMGSPSLRWVALEQVRQVLPLWEVYAECLRARGFSVWCGLLNSADYGVPQTRIRAILTASLDVRCERPEPTHAQHPIPSLFGTPSGWVSMAEALGWGFDEPSATVSGGGGGGAEPFANAGYRRKLAEIVTNQRTSATSDYYARDTEQPSPALTTNVRLWHFRASSQKHAAIRPVTAPAPAIMFGTSANEVTWVTKRPATTVAADPRIAAPGWRTGTERQHDHSIPVTVQEAAILQSFPADYSWQGPKTRQFEQCGNAVPPRLAAHVLASVLKIPGYLDAIESYYGGAHVS